MVTVDILSSTGSVSITAPGNEYYNVIHIYGDTKFKNIVANTSSFAINTSSMSPTYAFFSATSGSCITFYKGDIIYGQFRTVDIHYGYAHLLRGV